MPVIVSGVKNLDKRTYFFARQSLMQGGYELIYLYQTLNEPRNALLE